MDEKPRRPFGLPVWLIWGFIIGLSLLLLWSYGEKDEKHSSYISYSEFWKLVDAGKVREAIIQEQDVTAILKSEYLNKGSVVTVVIPEESQYEIAEKLRENGVNVRPLKKLEPGVFEKLLFSFLPTIIFVIFVVWLFRRMFKGQMGTMDKFVSIGKVRLEHEKPKVRFIDFAGCEEEKKELEEVVEFLKNPMKFVHLGAKIPKGVLLMGAPGTGKTLLAKAIAGEADVPFFSLSGSDFVETFVGVGAARVRNLFEQARKNVPCIIFIDELDSVGRIRGAGLGGGHDEREQTLNQLFVEIDGFESSSGIVLIAATNRPDILDPAFLRPGRFDRKIEIPPPDLEGRKAIYKVHLRHLEERSKRKDVHNIDEASICELAKRTPGVTGADIENFINEAALLAARENKKCVEFNDVERAIEKVMMGSERKSRVISPAEKEIIAVHEAGHTIVSQVLRYSDKVKKVSIIPRGRGLGATWALPDKDKFLWSSDECYDKLCVLVAGRAAEKIFLDIVTTGAEDDIERATGIAREMVTSWGMSKELGLLTLGKRRKHPFLGRDISEGNDISEEFAKKIDNAIKERIDSAYRNAERILRIQRRAHQALTRELLARETLTEEEINRIIAENPPLE